MCKNDLSFFLNENYLSDVASRCSRLDGELAKAAEKKKKYAAKAAAADGQSRPSERGKDPKRAGSKSSSPKAEYTTAETEAAPLEEQPHPEPDPAVSLGERSAPEATGEGCVPDPEGGAQDET